MVITSVSQTDDVGSIPAIRSGHLSRYIYLTALAFFFRGDGFRYLIAPSNYNRDQL